MTRSGEERRPHLLYVSWGFPPSRGAGVYRALATANYFVRNGWDVTVLTATRETFEHRTGVDLKLEQEVDPRVRIVRVPFEWPGAHPDISTWSRLRLFSDLLSTFIRTKLGALHFPESVYGAWKTPLIEATRNIHRATPVSLVIGTANPNVDFAPGLYLHKTYGIPYVMDHRDAWNMDVWTGKRIGTTRSNLLERKMIRNASELWFVNQPIAEWHASRFRAHRDRIHVVSNAFDESFTRQFGERKAPAPQAGLTFGYLGTIYGAIPLREFLEGWRLAREQSPLVRKSQAVLRGRLGHYAEADANTLQLLKEFEGDQVHYGGPVSKVEVANVYREFDALLLILGSSKFVTSGKVFEYAATGLPIAAIHEPETAATDVLRGYPLVCAAASLDSQAIARTIIEVADLAVKVTEDDDLQARAWATHLSRERQLQPRERALKNLINDSENAQRRARAHSRASR